MNSDVCKQMKQKKRPREKVGIKTTGWWSALGLKCSSAERERANQNMESTESTDLATWLHSSTVSQKRSKRSDTQAKRSLSQKANQERKQTQDKATPSNFRASW